MPLKLLYIVDSLGNVGGIERVISTKTNYLAKTEDYSIEILSLKPLPKELFFDFDDRVSLLSIDIDGFGGKYRRLFSLISDQWLFKPLESHLQANKYDIVISTCGVELGLLPKINDGSIKIAEFHFSRNYLVHLTLGLKTLKLKRLRLMLAKYRQHLLRSYTRLYQHTVLLTECDKKLWRGHHNLVVIPNPVSFRLEEKATCDTKQILAIGRLSAQKGFDYLIDAFSNIGVARQEWKLIILGNGPEKDKLQKQIDTYNMGSQISIIEPVANIVQYYLASSIFAFSSRYEGFGLVLTEAMEAGLPIVAFDCECGPSEIIKDGHNGFLVQNGDATALAAKLELLMSDVGLRKEMGSNSFKEVKRFYIDNVMSKWDNLFKSIAKTP